MVTNRRVAPALKPREPIAIVRYDDLSNALRLAAALHQGGVRVIEFTLTNGDAFDAIEQVRMGMGSAMVVGAGTVICSAEARNAIAAGAQFLVTPVYRPDVLECGLECDIPVVCGALTPTEIYSAWEAGAELVKVFPASQMGPAYLRALLAPMPDLLLVPTGGVTLGNCRAFLDAGAYTVAIGSSLLRKDLLAAQDWNALSRHARRLNEACTTQL